MVDQNPVGNGASPESQVLAIMARQLEQGRDPAERSTIYGLLGEILQRELELERGRHDREMQLDLRAREDRRHSTKRFMHSMLGLSVIVFASGVTLALRGFQDMGLFLLGFMAAFLSEAIGELPMRINLRKPMAGLVVALVVAFCGSLAMSALSFAYDLHSSEGLRQILVFLAGIFTAVTVSILSRAVKMMMRVEDPLP